MKVCESETTLNRGAKTKLYIYTAVPGALIDVFEQNTEEERKYSRLSPVNGVGVYEVFAPENRAVSQLNLQFRIVALGDVQTEQKIIRINEDKDLTIKTTVFRDKIEPGKKEIWSVKISGRGREKRRQSCWKTCTIWH